MTVATTTVESETNMTLATRGHIVRDRETPRRAARASSAVMCRVRSSQFQMSLQTDSFCGNGARGQITAPQPVSEASVITSTEGFAGQGMCKGTNVSRV